VAPADEDGSASVAVAPADEDGSGCETDIDLEAKPGIMHSGIVACKAADARAAWQVLSATLAALTNAQRELYRLQSASAIMANFSGFS
jgi:hypothetical protein